MRGPLLSGPLGSPATLERLCQLLRERPPALVLSALWLAEALSAELPVVALVEPDRRRAARRALRRAGRLLVVAAGEELPLGRARAGAVVVERLAEIEDDDEATRFLVGLLESVRPGGLVVTLDATRSPAVEARLSTLFLAAALTGVAQERPKEGAVLTTGVVPPADVVAARLAAE